MRTSEYGKKKKIGILKFSNILQTQRMPLDLFKSKTIQNNELFFIPELEKSLILLLNPFDSVES